MLFTVPSSWRISRKPYSTLVLKIHTKNFAKQENLSPIINSILKKGKMRIENYRQKLESKKTQVYALKTRLKRLFKNSISVLGGTYKKEIALGEQFQQKNLDEASHSTQ
jgi:hypothetical protein